MLNLLYDPALKKITFGIIITIFKNFLRGNRSLARGDVRTWPTSRQCLCSLASGTKPDGVMVKISVLNEKSVPHYLFKRSHKCLSSGLCVTALMPCAGDAKPGCCVWGPHYQTPRRSPDLSSFIVLSMSLQVYVLHTSRHTAEKAGIQSPFSFPTAK